MKKTELLIEEVASRYAKRNNKRIAKSLSRILEFDIVHKADIKELTTYLTRNVEKCLKEVIALSYMMELWDAQRRLDLFYFDIDDELIMAILGGAERDYDVRKLVYRNVADWWKDIQYIKTEGKKHKLPEQEIKNLIKAQTGTIGECGLTYAIMRILRTESNNASNRAAIQAYRDAGIKKYKYHAILDNKACTKCHDLNGRIFLVAEAKRGENLPPLHPNCRCYTTPVGNIIHRIQFEKWRKEYMKN